MKKIMLWAWLLLAGALNSSHAQPVAPDSGAARPLLHPLFSENAVLQRDRALTIWGWTRPRQSVVVRFDEREQTVRADQNGRWQAPLPAHKMGGPHALVVTGRGKNEIARRRNLVFGDLWLCAGQSNMEWPLGNAKNGAADVEAARHSDIRLMSVSHNVQFAPIEVSGPDKWRLCTPQNAASFSAIGYFFGRRLNRDLKVPIGLIQTTWGGAPAQSWVSAQGIAPLRAFDGDIRRIARDRDRPSALLGEWTQWWQGDPGTRANWQNADFDDADWKSTSVPSAWENEGFAEFDGTMWFRREVTVPASWAGRDIHLNWDNIDDNDGTFWNGELVGETRGFGKARRYKVPGAQVKAGRNSVAIRVLDVGGGGGLVGPNFSMNLVGNQQKISLAGAWKIKPSARLGELEPLPFETRQLTATTLYNGMIAPLLPAQIKGVIWYQGESNIREVQHYRALLPALIGDWRAQFGQPLPFYIVQLPNFRAPDELPRADDLPLLREAQAMAAKNLPATGLVVTTDIGEADNLHPANKEETARRLSLQALRKTYGQNVRADGPQLQSARAEPGKIVLTFSNADDLKIEGEAARVFAVAGNDGEFRWANPTLKGATITLRSPDVAAPAEARFGWSNNPRANLLNGAGLPASPFRTDKEPEGWRALQKIVARKMRQNPAKAWKLGAGLLLSLGVLGLGFARIRKLRARKK